MLSERELTELRGVAVRALPDTATILRTQRVSDGSLGSIETPVVVAKNVPCRVEEDNDGRGGLDIGGRASSTGELSVRLAYGVPVNEGDRIEVSINQRVRVFTVERIAETSFATVTTARVAEVR